MRRSNSSNNSNNSSPSGQESEAAAAAAAAAGAGAAHSKRPWEGRQQSSSLQLEFAGSEQLSPKLRRTSRGQGKDRHSKVNTAKGPRDRRVRLSVSTAIQFYDIQDRLGFDQPSKAIEWLLNKAKPAIDELNELAPPSAAAVTSRETPNEDDDEEEAEVAASEEYPRNQQCHRQQEQQQQQQQNQRHHHHQQLHLLGQEKNQLTEISKSAHQSHCYGSSFLHPPAPRASSFTQLLQTPIPLLHGPQFLGQQQHQFLDHRHQLEFQDSSFFSQPSQSIAVPPPAASQQRLNYEQEQQQQFFASRPSLFRRIPARIQGIDDSEEHQQT